MAAVAVTVRAITPADVATIASLHTRSWRHAYRGILTGAYLDGPIEGDRLATWRTRLHDDRSRTLGLIAEQDGTAVGFVYAYPDVDPQWGTLVDNLHVLPEARGMGLGRTLMREVAAALPSVATSEVLHLWVFEANHEARGFYERIGGRGVERALQGAPDGGEYPEWRMAWDRAALEALRAPVAR